MSFVKLNKKELLQAAAFFGIDEFTESNTKPEIIAGLDEDENATWDNYKKFHEAKKNNEEVPDHDPDEEVEPGVHAPDEPAEEPFSEPATEAVQFDRQVLLRMDRKNPTYEILGYKFTKDQPFHVMSEDDAQQIIDLSMLEGGGFRIATPAEARSYFG
jgi:hypothetical protein